MKKILLTAMAISAAWCMAPAQTVNPDELVNRLYTQIINAYNAQNWEQVTSLVQQLIDAGADIEDLEVNYCNALAESGETDKAAERLEAYLERNPEDYNGWNCLGDIQSHRMMPDLAIEAYTKSAELNQMFARPYVAMARLYGSADPAAAVDAYCRAMRIFMLADQPQGAIQFGSEAMKLDMRSSQLMLLMGEAFAQANAEDRALPFYAESLSIASKPETFDLETIGVGIQRIGMIYYKSKQYDNSLAYIKVLTDSEEFLSSLDPNMAQELLMLAAADSQRLGQPSESAAFLSKAHAVNPEAEIEEFYQSLLQLTE